MIEPRGHGGLHAARADVENIAGVEQLRAAGDLDDEAGAVRAEVVGGVKQARHAGVHKHMRHGERLGGINVRVRQHEVKESADFFQRVVNGDAQAGAERVGDEFRAGVVAHRHVRHADDERFAGRREDPIAGG